MSLHDRLDVFDAGHDHEQVVFANDPATGLRAIIAIHSTALGPALGGTRFFPYASTGDALADVLDLSRGMSYKAALAGLDLGGGKAVIIGDPAHVRARGGAESLFRAYGRFVQSLGGRYYTACDVGTFSPDMDDIARECSYVTGRTVAHGGAGDSSVLTAYGVFQGMRAAAQFTWGSPSLAGRTVGVAGVGKVGHHLVTHLLEDGASVVVTDVNAAALDRVRDEHPEVRVVDDRGRAGREPARRLRAVRDGRRAHRRGRRGADRQDRLRRRQQPARPPGRREGARGARHPLRARLLRELRRPDPGRRRARPGRLQLRPRPAARHRHLRHDVRRSSSWPRRTASRRRSPPTGSPSGGCATSAGCAGSGSAESGGIESPDIR